MLYCVYIYINTTNILFMFHNKFESFKTFIENFAYNGLFKTRIPSVVHAYSSRGPCVFLPYSTRIPPVFHAYSSRDPRVVQILTTRIKREK